MSRLGDNILALSKLRRAGETVMANLAEPGRLRLLAPSGSNPGALRMMTYVPPGLAEGAPLVVVLHGCTQNAAAYDHGTGWSNLADRHGFALLFPEQQRGNNSNLCFNWFQPGDIRRDEGEVLSIRQMVAQMIEAHHLNPARIYATGLSAGGGMAAALLAAYPEVFTAGAIIAGLPYGSAGNVQDAIEVMFSVRHHTPHEWGDLVRAASPHHGPWPHVQVWHGDSDSTVKPGNADELLKQWSDVHGVAEAPVTDRVDGAIHRLWRNPAGEAVLESYTIPGLGHGTPLHANAIDPDRALGFAAPHMLEAGISSTWHIARSWGLLTQAPAQATAAPVPEQDNTPPPPSLKIADLFGPGWWAAGLAPGGG